MAKKGGLYRDVNVSVKTVDAVIVIGIALLIAVVVFAIGKAG